MVYHHHTTMWENMFYWLSKNCGQANPRRVGTSLLGELLLGAPESSEKVHRRIYLFSWRTWRIFKGLNEQKNTDLLLSPFIWSSSEYVVFWWLFFLDIDIFRVHVCHHTFGHARCLIWYTYLYIELIVYIYIYINTFAVFGTCSVWSFAEVIRDSKGVKLCHDGTPFFVQTATGHW